MCKNWLSSIVLIILFWACKSDNPELQPEFYQACCGTQPVEYKAKEGSIYMPNVFTPNGDGINDLFFPIPNDKIVGIQSFTIKVPGKDTLLFYRQGIDLKDLKKFAWDGINYDGRDNHGFGEKYNGKFTYAMFVGTKDSTGGFWGFKVNGEACVIRCNKAAKIFKTKEGCYFAEQANGATGTVDKTKSSKEKNCFN